MLLSKLLYPKKSHRKIIAIPEKSTAFAEFMGIEFGDGGINNPWQVVITLNADADREYANYVIGLIKELFNISPVMRIRGARTLQIISSSTSLVDFLAESGAVRGNKIEQGIDFPCWIRGNEEYSKAFIRGLVDTDGCLYIHNHTVDKKFYKNIGFCFTSASPRLINSVALVFGQFGIMPHISDHRRRIYLYGEKSVLEYLKIFEPANPRIHSVYSKWKGAGVV